MQKIGIRELKVHATAILRQVREQGSAFEVTYRGQVVARLVPVEQSANESTVEEFLEGWDRLAERIGRDWPAGVSAVEAVREVRREL